MLIPPTWFESNQTSTVDDVFFQPAVNALESYTRNSREGLEFSDVKFIQAGIHRTLSQCSSGRDFLQHQREVYDNPIGRTAFFNSLHSERRLAMLKDVSFQVYRQGRRALEQSGADDQLGMFPELAGRPVWSGDGHHIEHACHALQDAKGRYVSVNTLYLLCLHTGMMTNLAPVQGNGRYAHELPAFRNALGSFLDHPAPANSKGRKKPIFLLDLAYIDNQFWDRCHKAKKAGAVLITRLKENMDPTNITTRAFDREDTVNVGVDSDSDVTFKNGVRMRLVVYTDPETGVGYQFLTTECELRPGVVAWLFFFRWRIEKLFDTAKNKLEEYKAWANGTVAQTIQGHFLALTHNLLVLFRQHLQNAHGLSEEKMEKKRSKILEERQHKAQKQKRQLHPLTYKMPAIIQLTAQFIRSVRNHIARKASFWAALPQFEAMLIAYL